jgi:hypothetical protein
MTLQTFAWIVAIAGLLAEALPVIPTKNFFTKIAVLTIVLAAWYVASSPRFA